MITEKDRKYLRKCVALAAAALEKGNSPFGSILVSKDGEVLFEDHNRDAGGDNTRHPEFEIAKWAIANLTEDERKESVVYTSGEHCSMCASAHGLAGLGRIVYATSSEQLQEWKEELGAERGMLKGLAVTEVLRDIQLDGPEPELAEAIKALHYEYHRGRTKL
ncbi:nucleoside deaminase [Lacicoccus alkaliphilus]|uniref:tRNA(Arg) A34 adenosine deaminase TadA n=1 Tax=Lacicoccus alkaliphilus DSM 16010 TaxID=1123231 RepID=A0A1M7DZA6_9BACL|nr:nucleoside deaminase [Salinicoccus alkaliphilus]SHL84824.1 tRNA(Arg) A34 adenosine deaminase TadA [Salinicoccus alkaliphilus DSM 16010]